MASGKPLDLEVTILSAKHLHNVNWRNGDLKPYVVFYLDSDHCLATHADDSGSTFPVWNESFALPINRPIYDSVLTIEILHSKFSDTPKPLVGSVKFPLTQLVDSSDSTLVRKIQLLRPSGRPQGTIRLKLVVKDRLQQGYQNTPENHHYYNPATVPNYSEFSFSPSPIHTDNYYYYSNQLPPPPPPSRPMHHHNESDHGSQSSPSAPVHPSPIEEQRPASTTNYGEPSAPIDYSPSDQKLSEEFGGLSVGGRDNYGKERPKERVASDFAGREGHGYNDYHRQY